MRCNLDETVTNRYISGRFVRPISILPAERRGRAKSAMDLRSGPPPPPRGKRAAQAYHEEHRLETQAGAGYHVPRRLGEREIERNHPPEDDAVAYESPPRNILAETPETTVGENVHVKGELSFERLLRVDGSFKGTLTSTGDLVIGATGIVRGNVSNLREILSDGTIIGNVQAERVRLRRSAVVLGDVTCQSLTMDPDVSISGKLNVHKDAPSKLHVEGEEDPEDEVADSNDAYLSDNKSTDSDRRHTKGGGGSNRKEGSSRKDGDRDRRQKDDKGKDEKGKDDKGKDDKGKDDKGKDDKGKDDKGKDDKGKKSKEASSNESSKSKK